MPLSHAGALSALPYPPPRCHRNGLWQLEYPRNDSSRPHFRSSNRFLVVVFGGVHTLDYSRHWDSMRTHTGPYWVALALEELPREGLYDAQMTSWIIYLAHSTDLVLYLSSPQVEMDGCPFDVFPDEVLREIFFHCLPDNLWDVEPAPTYAPVALTSVNRRWRTISLASPSLWSFVKVRLRASMFHPRGAELLQSFGHTCTSRSKLKPLSISVISWETAPWLAAPRLVQAFLVAVGGKLTRLVLIKIPIAQLLDIPANSFPALESLVYFASDQGYQLIDIEAPVIAFQDAPRLRRIALDTTFLHTGSPAFLVHYGLLTHFRDANMHKSCTPLFTRRFLTHTNLQWLGLELTDHE
ncbi:hypothetical protein NMY22_g10477 [Coprinellus aureogranulatus]|nr:hypothetical protein NMY22_g10477 [Coprinellus aureogranulatus]